jgi:uncharacterized protein
MHRKVNLQFFAEAAQQLGQEEKAVYLDFDCEFKASAEEKGVIEGFASTYGNLDRQNDIIEPAAFKSAHGKRYPIFALHDPSKAIGTGIVTDSEKGLYIKMKLEIENTDSDILRERAKEYYAMAKAGIIQKMSVGFITQEREWETRKEADGKERYIRRIKKGELLEVSLVPIPANPKAGITSIKEIIGDNSESEKMAKLEARIKELEEKLAWVLAGDDPEPGQDGKEDKTEKESAKTRFMKECMRRLQSRYPDQEQRVAICLSEWEKGKGGGGKEAEAEDQKKDEQQQQDEQQTENKKSLSCDYLIAAKLGLF